MVEIAGDVQLSGEGVEEAAEAVLGGVARAPRAGGPRAGRAAAGADDVAAGGGEEQPPPVAGRPRLPSALAARAAIAVAVGAAAGVLGAAVGRRRS